MTRSKIRQSGFSLLEVLIAIGILGATSVGMMRLFQNSNKASKDILTKDQVLGLHRELNLILSSPLNCMANLAGRSENDEVFYRDVASGMSGSVISYKGVEAESLLRFTDSKNRGGMKKEANFSNFIERATISEVNMNGTPGNNAIVKLNIHYKKLSNTESQRSGSNDIRHEMTLAANLCPRVFVTGADWDALNLSCTQGRTFARLVEMGPTSTNPTWGWCEVCDGVTRSSPIISCTSDPFQNNSISSLNTGAAQIEDLERRVDQLESDLENWGLSKEDLCGVILDNEVCDWETFKQNLKTQTRKEACLDLGGSFLNDKCDISEPVQNKVCDLLVGTSIQLQECGGEPVCDEQAQLDIFMSTNTIAGETKQICDSTYKAVQKESKVTVSQTFSPSVDMNKYVTNSLKVFFVGGGGGGGGGGGSNEGEGGKGGEVKQFLRPDPKESFNIQIGKGGAGGRNRDTDGERGGSTIVKVGSLSYSALGGVGGIHKSNKTGSGGGVTINGTFYPGAPKYNNDATHPGTGGSGGKASGWGGGDGGDGANGIVLFTWREIEKIN